jgi:hypothetical protein
MDAASANAEANAIRNRARAHKRNSTSERSKMRAELKRLDEFRAMCSKFGIEVVIEDEKQSTDAGAKGGRSDEHTKDSNDGAGHAGHAAEG